MSQQTTYILIAYNENSDKLPADARFKKITKEDFQTLLHDYFKEIELEEIPHIITSRRSFYMQSALQSMAYLIIDVKVKS